MGQGSFCCVRKPQLIESHVKTPNGDCNNHKKNECYETEQFFKSEHELIHEGLICAICLGVVRDAVKDPCGHVFGRKCIDNWLGKTQKCPYSQNHLTKAYLKEDKETQLKVEIELLRKEEQKETNQGTHRKMEQYTQNENNCQDKEQMEMKQKELSAQIVPIRAL